MPIAKELTLDMMFITERDFLDEKYLFANNRGNLMLKFRFY